MSDRNIELMQQKAKEATTILGELEKIANENDFGMSYDDGTISFEDWLSSDCYGEGNGEDFSVSGDNVWYSSNC